MSKSIGKVNRLVTRVGVALTLAGSALFAGGVASADDLLVQIDQTTPLSLSKPAATVMVGNPMIADIMAQTKDLFFVMGKTMGTTNIVALDEQGKTISNVVVHVTSIDNKQLVLHRGTARGTYSCAKNCEASVMPGDAIDFFSVITDENSTKVSTSE